MNDINLVQLLGGKEVWQWEKMNNGYCFDHIPTKSLNLKNLKLLSPICYNSILYELQLQEEKLFYKCGNIKSGFHFMHITHWYAKLVL